MLRASCVVLLFIAWGGATAEAQTRKPQPPAKPQRPIVEHGFVMFGAGGQLAPGDLSDHAVFEANAEAGSFDADYRGSTGLAIDAAVGFRVRRALGVAVAVSRATRTGTASVAAEIPHPFFDDRHRHVEGEAEDMSRTETAVHAQLYYELRTRGPWRIRLFGGPSYVTVEQELVTEVLATEEFPFDTAEFDGATRTRVDGSAIGVNAGIDVSRMVTRRVGLGGILRYVGAKIDLDAPDSRRVSTDAGGLHAIAGLRILF